MGDEHQYGQGKKIIEVAISKAEKIIVASSYKDPNQIENLNPARTELKLKKECSS